MRLTDTIEVQVSTVAKRWRETVPAKRFGALAVHKDLMQGKRQLWRITHVNSGLRVLGEIPLKAALAIAKELQAMPEWEDPRLLEGSNAGNVELFKKLASAVLEARAFHTAGGTREAA